MQYRTKEKLNAFFGVCFAVIFGLVIAAIVSFPIIMKLEFLSAATHYLETH